jgi:hypothetical protein
LPLAFGPDAAVTGEGDSEDGSSLFIRVRFDDFKLAFNPRVRWENHGLETVGAFATFEEVGELLLEWRRVRLEISSMESERGKTASKKYLRLVFQEER